MVQIKYCTDLNDAQATYATYLRSNRDVAYSSKSDARQEC